MKQGQEMKIRSIIFLLIFCVPLLTAAVPDIVEKQSGNIPAAVEKIADGAGKQHDQKNPDRQVPFSFRHTEIKINDQCG